MAAGRRVVGGHLGEHAELWSRLSEQRYPRECARQRRGDGQHEVVAAAQVGTLVCEDGLQLPGPEHGKGTGRDDDPVAAGRVRQAIMGVIAAAIAPDPYSSFPCLNHGRTSIMTSTAKGRTCQTPAARQKQVWDKAAPGYDKQIAFFEKIQFAGGREWLGERARGRVLEVAIGTGRNLPCYPADVTITGIEAQPRDAGHRQAARHRPRP